MHRKAEQEQQCNGIDARRAQEVRARLRVESTACGGTAEVSHLSGVGGMPVAGRGHAGGTQATVQTWQQLEDPSRRGILQPLSRVAAKQPKLGSTLALSVAEMAQNSGAADALSTPHSVTGMRVDVAFAAGLVQPCDIQHCLGALRSELASHEHRCVAIRPAVGLLRGHEAKVATTRRILKAASTEPATAQPSERATESMPAWRHAKGRSNGDHLAGSQSIVLHWSTTKRPEPDGRAILTRAHLPTAVG
eukprot:CAMPEP_0170575554 /NCGR_PEP_ID=MMETSP0224-20130122/3924_1 /TAXON_ID=285029 /ORGANISM="Togula jolla, Strain CCCM 725" /LENGTH=248 /DNA_ID=CAMNT_0010898343 /DNA_START=23 /DNA_END=766 /DNA_ORIENTATION=-